MKLDYMKVLGKLRDFHALLPLESTVGIIMDFYTKLCEDDTTGELIQIFTSCKLRPDAFFGFIRYKAGEISLDDFENKIIPILNRE